MSGQRTKIIVGLILFTLLYVGAMIRYQSLIVEHSEATTGWRILEILSTLTYIAGMALGLYLLRRS
ncbi:MAG: hypothetical protein GSR77_06780 [Desulfurococcales archaeon]|nr:hypothetical protein [Desulfurococcales archaeon]